MKDEKKTNQGSQMITILIIMALVMAMGYAYFKFTGTLL
jgi:Tfp pilus assembly protein PilO